MAREEVVSQQGARSSSGGSSVRTLFRGRGQDGRLLRCRPRGSWGGDLEGLGEAAQEFLRGERRHGGMGGDEAREQAGDARRGEAAARGLDGEAAAPGHAHAAAERGDTVCLIFIYNLT